MGDRRGVCPEKGTWFAPAYQRGQVRGHLTGAGTSFVVLLPYARVRRGTPAETKPRGLAVQLDHLRRSLRCQAADGCVQHLHQAAQAPGMLRQQRPAWLLNAGRPAP